MALSQVDFGDFAFAVHATHSAVNLLLALVLLGLYRVQRGVYLLHWGLSWLAFGLFLLLTAYASSLALSLPADAPWRLTVSALGLAAGCAQVAFLISGTWFLVRGRSGERGPILALSLLSALCGLVLVLGSLSFEAPQRLFARFGTRGLCAGLAFLGAAGGLLLAPGREARSWRRAPALLLLAIGVAELRTFGARFAELVTHAPLGTSALGLAQLVDLLLHTFLLASLLVWFFQLERRSLERATQALATSEQLLRRSEHMEAVGRLAGGVAHDFNNLLTAITGHAELLLSRTPQGHPDREDLQPIAKAATRAAELVRELLAFSRRQPLRPRSFSLDSLLRDMQKTLERVSGESVQVVLDLGAPGGVIQADPTQIELALLNLAANARDAISGRGVLSLRTAQVTLEPRAGSTLRPGAYVQLEVSDTGCGIPPESLGRVFEPFYTTKPGKGTGLGLASVYGIVLQTGGDIEVQSTVGIGTTFRCWLPCADHPAEATVELQPVPFPAGGSETILLVEDEVQVRQIAQRVLAKAGYRVLAAENGDQALKRVQDGAEDFDLLLSDLVMPGLGVRELVDALRERVPRMRVLLMSGYAEATLAERGMSRGFEGFLPKPFNAPQLLNAVRSALDADRKSGEAHAPGLDGDRAR